MSNTIHDLPETVKKRRPKGHPLYTVYNKRTDEYLCFDCTVKYVSFICGLSPSSIYNIFVDEKNSRDYRITRRDVSPVPYKKKMQEDLKRINLINQGELRV